MGGRREAGGGDREVFVCVCVCSDGSKVFVFTFFALVKTQKFKTRCFNFRCVSQFKKEKKSKCHKHGKK